MAATQAGRPCGAAAERRDEARGGRVRREVAATACAAGRPRPSATLGPGPNHGPPRRPKRRHGQFRRCHAKCADRVERAAPRQAMRIGTRGETRRPRPPPMQPLDRGGVGATLAIPAALLSAIQQARAALTGIFWQDVLSLGPSGANRGGRKDKTAVFLAITLRKSGKYVRARMVGDDVRKNDCGRAAQTISSP
jgi:hypothetical protein